MDEIFTIERHDDEYCGPNSTRFAKSVETAFELAAEEREQHRGTEWTWESPNDDCIVFRPACGTSGCVSIRSADLHE